MQRRSPKCLIAFGGLLVLVLASCSGPQLQVLDRPVSQTSTERSLTKSTALLPASRETLRTEDLLGLYRRDENQAILALAQRYAGKPTAARRQTLAEMCSDYADRLTSSQPQAALGYYLEAARLTEEATREAIGATGDQPDRILYNYSAARVARLLQDQGFDATTPLAAPGPVTRYRLTVARGPGTVPPASFDAIVPSDWLKMENLDMELIRQDGFGASMVGHRDSTPERKHLDPNLPDAGRGFALNASLRFSGDEATLVIQDLMLGSEGTIDGETILLAADFTAPLAFLYYGGRKRQSKLGAMLRPAKYQDRIRLFAVEPFRSDKTPLILVHGLMSSAEGWMEFLNLARANPQFRENYQVLLFNYPTGSPIAKSAADLRQALREFREFHDPDRSIPAMRDMVIIGHSMGGILSNGQIRTSGDRLYNAIFTQPLDALDIGDEERASLQRIAFFEANPDIDRAILMATPHRGSAYASNQIGQIGAWLIRLPFNIVDVVLGDIQPVRDLTKAAQEASMRPINGVTSLRPDSPLLAGILTLPIRDGVVVHSIIAQHNVEDPIEEGTDRVVRYTSSHLDGVASERIIMGSDHRKMVANPETIEEVWRILSLHSGAQDPAR